MILRQKNKKATKLWWIYEIDCIKSAAIKGDILRRLYDGGINDKDNDEDEDDEYKDGELILTRKLIQVDDVDYVD